MFPLAGVVKVTSEDAGVVNRISKVLHSAGLQQLMLNTAESRLTVFRREVVGIVGG